MDSVIQPSHNRGLEMFPQLVNAYKYGLVIPPLKATFSRGMKDKAGGGDEKKVIRKIKNESVTFELIKDIFIIPPTHSSFFAVFKYLSSYHVTGNHRILQHQRPQYLCQVESPTRATIRSLAWLSNHL